MSAPNLSDIVAEIVAEAPPLDGDRVHELNTYTQIRMVEAMQETAYRLRDLPRAAHPGYVKLLRDQSRVLLIAAAALDRFVQETAADIQYDPPSELGLGRVADAAASLLGGPPQA